MYYVIRRENDDSTYDYWSMQDGWTAFVELAAVFTLAQTRTNNLPLEGEYIKLNI